MRGTFDFETEQYPFLVQHVGTNEVVVRNALNGDEYRRQPLAGAYDSPERKAQSDKLSAVAIRLCRASREAKKSGEAQPAQ